jgi:alkylation response protein AidB-like acyl-CoA dehydrogenase
VQIQPLIDMSGGHVFNQEFFDNLRVPARNRVGEENRGWYVGATLLDFERSGIGGSIGLRHQVADLLTFVREASTSGPVPVHLTDTVRTELAERTVEAEIAKLISYRLISIQKRGQVPNYEASMNKNFRAEAAQRLAQTGINLLGLYGNVYGDSRLSAMKGRITRSYLSSVSATIAAGTSEINRNVIATRGLGLPRG